MSRVQGLIAIAAAAAAAAAVSVINCGPRSDDYRPIICKEVLMQLWYRLPSAHLALSMQNFQLIILSLWSHWACGRMPSGSTINISWIFYMTSEHLNIWGWIQGRFQNRLRGCRGVHWIMDVSRQRCRRGELTPPVKTPTMNRLTTGSCKRPWLTYSLLEFPRFYSAECAYPCDVFFDLLTLRYRQSDGNMFKQQRGTVGRITLYTSTGISHFILALLRIPRVRKNDPTIFYGLHIILSIFEILSLSQSRQNLQ